MTKQHKALELADRLESLHDCSPASPDAAAELRRLHALVVQMRDAIRKHQSCDFNSDHPALNAALTAANEYLEQP